jgi:hypothetical protein
MIIEAQRPLIETADLALIRWRTSDILNRLASQLMGRMSNPDAEVDATALTPDPVVDRLQAATGKLGLLAAGLAVIDAECIPANAAGYGSEVQTIHMDSGRKEDYTLLISPLMDIQANHVSLASPIGQALLGRSAGDEAMIITPQRRVVVRVADVRTLPQILDEVETEFLDE